MKFRWFCIGFLLAALFWAPVTWYLVENRGLSSIRKEQAELKKLIMEITEKEAAVYAQYFALRIPDMIAEIENEMQRIKAWNKAALLGKSQIELTNQD